MQNKLITITITISFADNIQFHSIQQSVSFDASIDLNEIQINCRSMYNRSRINKGENRVIRFKCTLQNTIADVLRSRGWQEVKEESGCL